MKKLQRDNSALWIINELYRRGSILGTSVQLTEFDQLIDSLLQRLSTNNEILNFTPESLNNLEVMLNEYYLKYIDQDNVSYESIAQIVREGVAYFGKVVLVNTDAEWEPLGTLHGTNVRIYGKITGRKDGKPQTVPSILVPLGSIVAVLLDKILIGNKEEKYLLNNFISIRKKHFDGV